MSFFVKVANLDSGNICNTNIYSMDTSKLNQYTHQTKYEFSSRPSMYYKSLFFFLRTITENIGPFPYEKSLQICFNLKKGTL